MANPFIYGNPVPPEHFVGRRHDLRRIVSRIRNLGQSSAVIGEPRCGKTSLLHYLAAPDKKEALFGEDADTLLFSYLDAQPWGVQFDQTQFWEFALRPLSEPLATIGADAPLNVAYRTCQENGFGTFVLERLLAQMKLQGLRLVLILDEFDLVLHHPILNSAEFFGSLRSLASRSQGALALIIACRSSLTHLNKATQQLNPTGSPYFNFLDEITLGPLTKKGVETLLHRAEERFTVMDRDYVAHVSGGHPYLVQVAASALWEAYEEQSNPRQRRQQAGEDLHHRIAATLSDSWRLWSPEKRRAFTAIALAHIGYLGEQRKLWRFSVSQLLKDLRYAKPELHLLKKQGFIKEDNKIKGGWRVRPAVFLWWMTDEIVRAVHQDVTLEEWLQQEWEGVWTQGSKKQFKKIMGTLGKGLDVTTKLIAAVAEGVTKASLYP